MINANELRIGNWVKLKDIITTYQKVIMIDGEVNVIQCKNDIHSPLADYEPIPLTEEILLKCGFKRGGYDTLFLSNGKFEFSGIGYSYYGIRINNEYDIELKYLHQLQNLYFALTGEELEINL